MKIQSIQLDDYRNYRSLYLDGFEDLNVVTGRNAIGKTNLLESIYLCSVGKSNRNVKDKELIRWGGTSANVKITVSKKYRNHSVVVNIDALGKKRILVDGAGILKLASLLGTINTVYFSPDEMRLIKESPSDRRRFIDISLCQHNKKYLSALSKYNDVLEQRNKLLKEDFSKKDILSTLEIWDGQFASYAAIVISERKKFVKRLNELAKEKCDFITDGAEKLSLEYESDSDSQTIEEIENDVLSALNKNKEKETELRYTLAGPHRDDLKIACNGIDLRKFGSQGQQRTATLSVKLAEAELLKERTGEAPIVLLDDVLSELDAKRTKKLLEALDGFQAFISCTEWENDVKAKVIKIEEIINKSEIASQ